MTPREARAAPCATGFAVSSFILHPSSFAPMSPFDMRPEARQTQARQMLRDAAAHLTQLSHRTDLDDEAFELALANEIILVTNARAWWKKAREEKTRVLKAHTSHLARIGALDL